MMKSERTHERIMETIKKFRDHYTNSYLKNHPRDNMYINGGEIIRYQFLSQYCYYFAKILQDMFDGKGEVCFWIPISHVIWKYKGRYYDIIGEVHPYDNRINRIISSYIDEEDWVKDLVANSIDPTHINFVIPESKYSKNMKLMYKHVWHVETEAYWYDEFKLLLEEYKVNVLSDKDIDLSCQDQVLEDAQMEIYIMYKIFTDKWEDESLLEEFKDKFFKNWDFDEMKTKIKKMNDIIDKYSSKGSK